MYPYIFTKEIIPWHWNLWACWLLQLRSAIDPKRHYKKGDSKSKTLPKYFQASLFVISGLMLAMLEFKCDCVGIICLGLLGLFLVCLDFCNQVGTVVESASDFFTGRLTKKQRKATIADELLSDHTLAKYRWDMQLCLVCGYKSTLQKAICWLKFRY